MAQRDERHAERSARRRRRRRLGPVGDALVILLLVLAGVSWHVELGDRLGLRVPDPRREPALVLPPPGLDLPSPRPPAPVAAAAAETGGDSARVAAALRPFLRDRSLGRHLGLLVTDLAGGDLLRVGADRVTPASTTKILTSVAALETLGPDRRFTTRVVRSGRLLTLVGGGDPLLARTSNPDAYPRAASLEALARRTAQQVGRGPVRLAYDDSLFTGPAVNPAWPASYLPDEVVPPITALWDDRGAEEGFGFVDDPSADAAADFAALLRRQGVRVVGVPAAAVAAPDAIEVASVDGPTVGELVERLMVVSDNNTAEVLAHQVAIAEGQPASFAGAAMAVTAVMTRLGVPMTGSVLRDGSGLSRENLLRPETLAAAVRVAASEDHPQLRRMIAGMPVAGYTGSLADRFDTGDPAGAGRVQTKTGTLTGIHGLAGVVTDVNGTAYAFVFIADRAPPQRALDTRDVIDRAAAALAACACSTPATG